MSLFGRRGLRIAAALAAVSGATYAGVRLYQQQQTASPSVSMVSPEDRRKALEWRPPPRSLLLKRLASESFDLVIVGGGATGAGCALDGASRGLRVALVERDDFSSGTSSKSTKLVHGGVRYLEKAFLRLDWGQFQMVREALHERATFLRIAPHLTSQLPIMVPIYRWFMVPYYWAGSKVYDLVAGSKGLEPSYFLTSSKALEAFPMLRKDRLVGAMVYYDGEQNDARTNVALALTAIQQGAVVTNYTEVTDLLKDEETGRLCGAIVRDRITGASIRIKCKGIISATGPFCGTVSWLPVSRPSNACRRCAQTDGRSTVRAHRPAKHRHPPGLSLLL